jgi:hypothetical protein
MLISHKLVEGSKGSSTVAVVEFAEQSLPHNIIRQPSEVARSFRLLSAVSLSRSHRPQLIRSSWPRLLLENSLHVAGADAKLLADLEDAVTTGPQL